MSLDKANRDALIQPTEHVAAATIGLHAVHRPLPRRSFPADHSKDLSVSEWAENIQFNRETASKQQHDIASVTPAGLESQGLADQPKPGHWNRDEKGGVHLSSFRFPHPHSSQRLSFSSADGLPSEVTSQGDAHDDDTAAEQDNLMALETYAGGSPLQRCPSTSSSGSVEPDDRRSREMHPGFLASIRRRSSEVHSRLWRDCRNPKNELKGQDPESGQTTQV
jgi:hypothetical protein